MPEYDFTNTGGGDFDDDPFVFGGEHGPYGDIDLDQREFEELSKYGQYYPTGMRWDEELNMPVPWDAKSRRDLLGLDRREGRGGGGGRGPKYGQPGYQYTGVELGLIKDRFAQMVMDQTGMTPAQMGTSFNWFKPLWEGGWSQGDFERYYRGTTLFKETYKGIPEEWAIDDYDSVSNALNEYSLEYRGGKQVSKDEMAELMETGEVPF